MTTEEAFVKAWRMHGIEKAFGIIGLAMIADGCTRATGQISMMVARNGARITSLVTLGIVGDADRSARKTQIAETKSRWTRELTSMDHEDDDPGTSWNERARNREPEKISPRMAWRAVQAALPKEAIISSDIGNNCAIGNAYPTFEEGRKYLAPSLFGPAAMAFRPSSRPRSAARMCPCRVLPVTVPSASR